MNKLYDLLKYIIYASFYMIVIKTGMDFYGYKVKVKSFAPRQIQRRSFAALAIALSRKIF